jgi:hypothetical protein
MKVRYYTKILYRILISMKGESTNIRALCWAGSNMKHNWVLLQILGTSTWSARTAVQTTANFMQ